MKKHTTWVVAILSIVSFLSCEKDEEVVVKTKTELITSSSWKFDKATAGTFGDVSSYVNACYKDNTFTFAANGTGNVDESTNICSPSSAGAFTWTFQNSESTLNVSANLFQTGSTSFTLVSLTETNMVISQPVTLPPPVSITAVVEFTLKH
jgi:anaerobic selenocysteine-containing dehydrogenase